MTSNFQVEPFEILKINLNITLHVLQMVDFVQNENFQNVTFTFPPTKSPCHQFQFVFVQNMTPSQLHWCHTDEIGQFHILTLSKKMIFTPEYVNTQLMSRLIIP